MKTKKLIESLRAIFFDQLLKECEGTKDVVGASTTDALASYAKKNRLPDKMSISQAVITTLALESFSHAFICAGGHNDYESMKAYHSIIFDIQYNIIVSLHKGSKNES